MISGSSFRAAWLVAVCSSVLLPAPALLARPSDQFSSPFSSMPAPVVYNPAELRQRAEAGDAAAQYAVGVAYQLGVNIARDDQAARGWFEKAAAQDYPAALAALGFMRLLGLGGPLDLTGAEQVLRQAGERGEAAAWANLAELILAYRPAEKVQAITLLERAVADGAINARYRLGRFLIEGELVPKDAARGIAMLREAAAHNSHYAQAYLAHLILEGQITPVDPVQGFTLAQQAAEAGLAEGLNELGRYYLNGFGTARDNVLAARLFGKAGELGDPNGWFNLAMIHEDGRLGTVDEAEARRLYLRAAAVGYLPAAGAAGRMLYRGRGGPKDTIGALPYLQMAANAGQTDAQNLLALLLFNGEGGSKPDAAAAMDMWERAVELGYGPAVNNFATYLAIGRGRPADPDRARRLIAAQAEKGFGPSQFRWALWQEQGWQGTPKDLPAAIGWFARAAENGHAAAAFKYASYLEAGEGVAADPVAARRWYKAGAERGNADAQFHWARLLFNGDGGEADPVVAMDWLERAARQNHPEALFVLGDLTYRGEGRPSDPPLAWAYLRMAESGGVVEAGPNRRHVESRLSPTEREQAIIAAHRLAGSMRREREEE